MHRDRMSTGSATSIDGATPSAVTSHTSCTICSSIADTRDKTRISRQGKRNARRLSHKRSTRAVLQNERIELWEGGGFFNPAINSQKSKRGRSFSVPSRFFPLSRLSGKTETESFSFSSIVSFTEISCYSRSYSCRRS